MQQKPTLDEVNKQLSEIYYDLLDHIEPLSAHFQQIVGDDMLAALRDIETEEKE